MVNLVFDDSKAKRKGKEREGESSRDESTINEGRGGIDASGETRNVNASSCNASSVISIITRILFLPLDAIGAIFHAEDNG